MSITSATIIRRSLFARLFSTITTIITVAVAVGLMLVLLSMGESSRKAFERGAGNMHLLVSNDTNRLVSVLNAVFYAGAPAGYITWDKYREVDRLVRGRLPVKTNEFVIPIQQGDSYRGFAVLATTPEFFERFSTDPEYQPPMEGDAEAYGWILRDGQFLQEAFDIVVGAEAARLTGLSVGDEIHLTHGLADQEGAHQHNEWTWTVRGILEATGSAHDRALFAMLESSWLIHAQDFVNRESDNPAPLDLETLDPEYRKITGLLIRVPTRPGRTMSASSGEIAYQLAQDPALMVAEPRTEVNNLFEIVSNIDDILIGMAAIVMISSGIAIMLALYNSMEQRRRQIAVLRVLGASRQRIFALVIIESALIGLAGALTGIALCLVASQIVAAVLKARLGLVVSPQFDPLVVLAVTGGTILLAGIAGIIPAFVAYRTSVARNLRPMG